MASIGILWQEGVDMERNEISAHEVKVFRALAGQEWMTNREIAKASGVAERTVRLHTMRFVKIGIADLAEIFPAHRYRLSKKADKRNGSYLRRLEEAASILGV